MKSITVYCGASAGTATAFKESAIALGEYLAAENLRLVYGGAQIGLMGALASTVMAHGGDVLGIMTEHLAQRELSKPDITEFIIVADMHARKKRMLAEGDAFIALPGGCGTMEEIFEVITWSQIGLHQKPVAFLNVAGYYDQLAGFLDQMVASGFTQPHLRKDILITSSLEEIMTHFREYHPTSPRTYE